MNNKIQILDSSGWTKKCPNRITVGTKVNTLKTGEKRVLLKRCFVQMAH